MGGRILALGGMVVAAALFAGTAQAATDGTLGATSTGTAQVSLTVPQRYQIGNLADFAFGTYAGTGDLTANDDLCVYTNDAAKAYRVRVTDSSSMSASGFSVQNAGNTADIAYAVKWNNAAGTSGNQNVTYNTLLAGTNANTASATCATGGKTANLQITLAAASLQAAPAGAYAATITVIIEP